MNTKPKTVTVLLRGLPAELRARAKATAALRGQTLQAFVIDAIAEAVKARGSK